MSEANALELISVCSSLYYSFLAAAKFSMFLFFFKPSHLPWFRIAIYANTFLVVSYNITIIFHLIFTGTPI